MQIGEPPAGPDRRRPPIGAAARAGKAVLGALLAAVLGALVGLAVGVATPAHVELAGSDARVWLEPGSTVDQVGVTGAVTLKRRTDRSLLGQPVAVRALVDLDISQLVHDGAINTDVIPAYVQAYSDPMQIVAVVRHQIIWHLARFVIAGAVTALLLAAATTRYRRWRRAWVQRHYPDPDSRAAARYFRVRERVWAARGAAFAVAVLAVAAVPSAHFHPPQRERVVGNPVLADTPLAGVEVDGLLAPALVAARNYIQTYAGQTDAYYTRLEQRLQDFLAGQQIDLAGGRDGEDIVHLGYVTDRHCNTGMDRIAIALLRHFGAHLLVSGGDDAFSGTFSFEAACTRNLAQLSHAAGVADVFVGGNHDSPMTLHDERGQGITVLDGSVVTVDGLRFVGLPDPRTSRYGQGIRPRSETAQARVVAQQAAKIAQAACGSTAPIIAVAHDPRAGTRTLQQGCSNVTLALDGHTHRQSGPHDVLLQDGSTGEQFTGGSSGGAPSDHTLVRTFASRLTVGPLNHDAYVYLVSVARTSGRLAGITTFRFTPDGTVTVSQMSRP